MTTLLVVAAAAVIAVAVFAYVARRAPERTPAAPVGDALPDLDPADVADLQARFDSIDVGQVRRRDELLVSRLRPLVDKRVPVRVVEPVPELHSMRIRFADGTAVIGHGERAGDAGLLASMIRGQSVWPGAYSTDAAGTHLRFDSSRRRTCVSVVVTGLDQPD
jgi:hypothetical protein